MILLIHWLADFCLQTDEQALGKSKEFYPLFWHVTTYSTVFTIIMYCILGTWSSAIVFGITTFFCHIAIDYYTSRAVRHFFEKNDRHNGFVIIGFDQILHYIQLFLTFVWLKELV